MTGCGNLETVKAVAYKAAGRMPSAIVPILGNGVCNSVFDLAFGSEHMILRMSAQPSALAVYRKEAWCIAQTAVQGVPGPDVFAVDRTEGHAYMLQSKIEGISGSQLQSGRADLWREIGRLAAMINAVSERDHTGAEDPDGVFAIGWRRWLSDLSHYVSGCPFAATASASEAQREFVLSQVGRISESHGDFRLIHGNMMPKNVIIGPDGLVSVLDYGDAFSGPAPLMEAMDVIAWEGRDSRYFEAFREGYGISADAFDAMMPDLAVMGWLRLQACARWSYESGSKDSEWIARKARKFSDRHFPETGIPLKHFMPKLELLKLEVPQSVFLASGPP